MTSLAAVRAGLAANLDAIPDIQVSAYMLSNPTPPAIEIHPSQTDYDLALKRGLDRWRFTVRAFVGLTSDIGAQKRLDRMLASSGSESVKAAVESNPSLSGVIEDLRVINASGYRQYLREGASAVLGAEWEVEVLAIG
jgi:hypothetical protein